MSGVRVRIQRATLVRTNPNSKYEWRTDWKTVRVIDYGESGDIFACVDAERGLGIQTDAQFAKWLVDNFGLGRYILNIWKKKYRGFTFMMFDCRKADRFCQVMKEKSKRRREKDELVREFRTKKRELERSDDESEKETLKGELEDIEEMAEIEEIIDLDEEEKKIRPRIKIFKNTLPIYKEHEYEEYGIRSSSSQSNTTSQPKQSIWRI